MAATAVDLCNRALQRIGHTREIQSLDEDTPEADLCRLNYDSVREELLESFAWPFATRREVLAPLAGVTRTDWCHAFLVPASCLFARYVATAGVRNPTADQRVPFQLEASADGTGQVLLCDEDAPELVFTMPHVYVPTWPAGFRAALEWKLAALLALALKKDARLASVFMQKGEAEADAAAARAANQAQLDVPQDAESIRARTA